MRWQRLCSAADGVGGRRRRLSMYVPLGGVAPRATVRCARAHRHVHIVMSPMQSWHVRGGVD